MSNKDISEKIVTYINYDLIKNKSIWSGKTCYNIVLNILNVYNYWYIDNTIIGDEIGSNKYYNKQTNTHIHLHTQTLLNFHTHTHTHTNTFKISHTHKHSYTHTHTYTITGLSIMPAK